MKKNLLISIWMTLATTVLLGVIYPLVVTGLAQLIFKDKANGQLIVQNGKVVGSRIIGQAFTGSVYFHSRPSNAGSGYDAANSSASNLGPTNKNLIDRVNSSVASEGGRPDRLVPVDLVTTSGSGLDPHITPAAAEFQIDRIAKERRIAPDILQQLVLRHTEGRQWRFLGEPRVNVLELNLELDRRFPVLKPGEAAK